MASLSWLSKAFGGNVLQAVLDPAGTAVRALTNKGDTSTKSVGDFLDPAHLGAGKFTDAKVGSNGGGGAAQGAPAGGPAGPSGAAFNPFAQFSYQPGIGYATGASGANPFAGVAQSIPPSFFRNPQAMAALFSILNQSAPQAPSNVPPSSPYSMPLPPPTEALQSSTPGPDPSGPTMYNSTGGFGNGGGTMNMGQRKWSGSPWVRAL